MLLAKQSAAVSRTSPVSACSPVPRPALTRSTPSVNRTMRAADRTSTRMAAAIEDVAMFQNMTYGVMGLTATSFLSLFFVLPRAVLIDVRLPAKYDEVHADNSVNVPLFIPIQKWDIPSNLRRAGFAFFGIYGTEINPEFTSQVEAAAKKGQEVVIMCATGGNMENKQGTKTGFQSRSLKAAYYCMEAGYKKVFYVTGGFSAYTREGLGCLEAEE
eukprot:gene10073-7970_t